MTKEEWDKYRETTLHIVEPEPDTEELEPLMGESLPPFSDAFPRYYTPTTPFLIDLSQDEEVTFVPKRPAVKGPIPLMDSLNMKVYFNEKPSHQLVNRWHFKLFVDNDRKTLVARAMPLAMDVPLQWLEKFLRNLSEHNAVRVIFTPLEWFNTPGKEEVTVFEDYLVFDLVFLPDHNVCHRSTAKRILDIVEQHNTSENTKHFDRLDTARAALLGLGKTMSHMKTKK